MGRSPDTHTDHPRDGITVNIDGLEELTAIREALDGIREDLDWYLKNHRREQWLPMQPITSMLGDPIGPDWAERVNKFSAADLPETGPAASAARRPNTRDMRSAAEGLDDETQFCCGSSDLQWTGDPQSPGIACMNCGYVVADCGSVVMQPSPEADPDPKPNEQQRGLFADD